jgi:hypothetical protein
MSKNNCIDRSVIDKLYPSLISDGFFFYMIYQLNAVLEKKDELVLIKMTSDFKIVWQKLLQGNNKYYPSIILNQKKEPIISYGTIVNTSDQLDVILSKYGVDGSLLWELNANNINQSQVNLYPSIVIRHDNIYLTYQRKQINTSQRKYKSFVVVSQYNQEGVCVWTYEEQEYQSSIDFYPSICVDIEGNCYVSYQIELAQTRNKYDINIIK